MQFKSATDIAAETRPGKFKDFFFDQHNKIEIFWQKFSSQSELHTHKQAVVICKSCFAVAAHLSNPSPFPALRNLGKEQNFLYLLYFSIMENR